MIRDRHGNTHLVFELLPGGNLEALTRSRNTPLTETQIRTIFHQLLQAMHYMHSRHFMHRDIKPENILLTSSHLDEDGIHIKVADLGLAKSIRTSTRPHTTYISTRWYRSPEILLRMTNYGAPSDMWAVGAVMAELVTNGQPLAPGDDENDQLALVLALRGHPSQIGWRAGNLALRNRGVNLPATVPKALRTVLPQASPPVLQLISDLLEMDPAKRPSAAHALAYPVFLGCQPRIVPPPPGHKRSAMDRVRRRDTARTSEFPSGRWSADSERANDPHLRQQDLNYQQRRKGLEKLGSKRRLSREQVVAEPPFKKSHKESPLGGDSEQVSQTRLFNIPHPVIETDVSVSVRRIRKPAEHFNMRLLNESR